MQDLHVLLASSAQLATPLSDTFRGILERALQKSSRRINLVDCPSSRRCLQYSLYSTAIGATRSAHQCPSTADRHSVATTLCVPHSLWMWMASQTLLHALKTVFFQSIPFSQQCFPSLYVLVLHTLTSNATEINGREFIRQQSSEKDGEETCVLVRSLESHFAFLFRLKELTIPPVAFLQLTRSIANVFACNRGN